MATIYNTKSDRLLSGTGGNDTLVGGTGADTFLYHPNEGTDRITDYNYSQGDLLQILNTNGSEASYTATFSSSGGLSLAVSGGGTVVLSNVKAGGQVNINGTTRTVTSNGLS